MKVLCKKTILITDGIFKIDFKMCHFYTILYEFDDCCWIKMDDNCSQRFDKIGGTYKYKLSDYFYTTVEMRKFKLRKLNEMSS